MLVTANTPYILVPAIEADDLLKRFRQPLDPSLRLFLGHFLPNS
jgi:hypothetical protein